MRGAGNQSQVLERRKHKIHNSFTCKVHQIFHAEEVSREQDITNQLLKASYYAAGVPLLALFDQVASARIKRDKRWQARLFIISQRGRHSWNIRPDSTPRRAAGVCNVYLPTYRISSRGNYVIGVTRAKGHLTNIRERSNKSNNLGRNGLRELGSKRARQFLKRKFLSWIAVLDLFHENFYPHNLKCKQREMRINFCMISRC